MITLRLILSGCLCVSACDVGVLWLNAETARVDFWSADTTGYSYFWLDESPDPSTQRDTYPDVGAGL